MFAKVFGYDRETMGAYLASYGSLTHKVHHLPKPVVASIPVHTFAGGTILAIDEYLALRNEQPKRYQWRAKGEEIRRKSSGRAWRWRLPVNYASLSDRTLVAQALLPAVSALMPTVFGEA